jgi:hypothetical protein
MYKWNDTISHGRRYIMANQNMSDYTMMSNSYKLLMEQGKLDKTTAKKAIRIYDFLATCDSDDICQMVDSSAFNDIIRAFLRMAVKNSELDKNSQDDVLNQLYWIFDEKTAKEVLEEYIC